MNVEEEVIKNKNMVKMCELKIKAIINLLSKEGILTHEEIEKEVSNLIGKKDKETSES